MEGWNFGWIKRNSTKRLAEVTSDLVPRGLSRQVVTDDKAPYGLRRVPLKQWEVQLPELRIRRRGPGQLGFTNSDEFVRHEEKVHLSVAVATGVAKFEPDPVRRSSEARRSRKGLFISDPCGFRAAWASVRDALRALPQDPDESKPLDFTGHLGEAPLTLRPSPSAKPVRPRSGSLRARLTPEASATRRK